MHDSNPRLTVAEELEILESDGGPISRPRALSLTSGTPTRARVFCSACQEIVGLVTVAEAAAEFNTDLQDIRYLLSRNDIHSVPRDPAVISICMNSLAVCFDSRQTRLLDSHFEVAARYSTSDRSQ